MIFNRFQLGMPPKKIADYITSKYQPVLPEFNGSIMYRNNYKLSIPYRSDLNNIWSDNNSDYGCVYYLGEYKFLYERGGTETQYAGTLRSDYTFNSSGYDFKLIPAPIPEKYQTKSTGIFTVISSTVPEWYVGLKFVIESGRYFWTCTCEASPQRYMIDNCVFTSQIFTLMDRASLLDDVSGELDENNCFGNDRVRLQWSAS